MPSELPDPSDLEASTARLEAMNREIVAKLAKVDQIGAAVNDPENEENRLGVLAELFEVIREVNGIYARANDLNERVRAIHPQVPPLRPNPFSFFGDQ